jgi:DNA-binding CsgD family transcriptional regulator
VADQYRRAEAADQGLVWAVRAAVAAEKGFAIAEAGHWYAEAAALWDAADDARSDVPEKLALLTSAASQLASVGQTAEAMELLAGDLATMSDTAEEVVRAAIARCWLGTTVGDTEQALRDVELAQRLTPAYDEQTRARICAGQAMALGTCSRWDEALEPARTALDLGMKCGDTRTVGMAHALLGTLSTLEGRLSDAIAHHQTALVIAYRLAEPEDLAIAGVLLTDVAIRLGQPDRAMKVAGVVGPEVQRLMLGRHWLEDLMDSNVIQALYEAGRWDEALAWVSDPLTLSDLGFVQLMLAEIHLARGDVSLAEELLAQAASLGERDQPMFAVAYAQCQARLLLETGRAEEALQVAVSVVGAAEAAIESLEEGGVLLVGAEAAATVGAPDQLEVFAALLGGATKGRIGAAVAATFEAERTRAMGASDPDRWLVAAQEWAAVGQPYEEARVRRRAAEAMLVSRPGAAARQTAAEQLTAARHLADELGAAPLRHEIDKLARLARIDLGKPDQADEHPHKVQDLALTDREQQVLALLADGRTNREIGDALYMSPKTASVHVTHILEKLGVQSRVQAAAVAVRLGLDEPRQN